jgi:hypothetical protein
VRKIWKVMGSLRIVSIATCEQHSKKLDVPDAFNQKESMDHLAHGIVALSNVHLIVRLNLKRRSVARLCVSLALSRISDFFTPRKRQIPRKIPSQLQLFQVIETMLRS